ncbi:MAG TPA: alanine dehydrogenase [Verrucomicrobiae bacterium]|nr:alanine dehydrogenase [Verrucomicrobiae bacterium]
MLTIGIPREIKSREKRVGMTPDGVRALTARSVSVVVQTNAGAGSGFSDADYRAVGAEILPDAKSVYARAGLIQKVKEPLPPEYPLLRQDLLVFCFFHLAAPEQAPLLDALIASGATAIGYESLEIQNRRPLLQPMSEIAGGLSASYAAYFLKAPWAFRDPIVYPASLDADLGAIASRYPEPAGDMKSQSAVVWGGGIAGEKAMEFLLKMGAGVTLVEKYPPRAAELQKKWQHAGKLQVCFPEALGREVLGEASVFVGCVHQTGRRALQVIDEKVLEEASRAKKKMIMDVSIDQGGNFPGAKATTYESPLVRDRFGNVRFSVANIPSLCGPGASAALTRAALPYTHALAENPAGAFEKFPELEGAVNVRSGQILLPAVREAHPSGNS